MKLSASRLFKAGALASLAIFSASSVTAHCSVWWQSRCCRQAGISGVTCTQGGVTWFCAHNIVDDPAVGVLSAADAGWTGPWAIGNERCEYFIAGCGFNPGSCIYAFPSVFANCTTIAPPGRPPNCDKCP